MAGGKLSPRQKMINLMYLVFIAMLALNMSKEVLSAFGFINEEVVDLNQLRKQVNTIGYEELAVKASEQPEKYKEKNAVAVEVKRASSELYNYVGDIKNKIQADLDLDDPTDYQAMDKGDFLDEYFFGQNGKNGKEYVKKIEDYRKLLLSKFDTVKNPDYKNVVRLIAKAFNTDDIRIDKTTKQPYLSYHYEGFPAIASITKLSSMQSSITRTEDEILNAMVGKQLRADAGVSQKTYQALFLPSKPSFFPGEKVTGSIVLGRYDASLLPKEVIVNGKSVAGRLDGGAKLEGEIIAGNVGERDLKGDFVFMQDGKEVKIPIETKYSVVAKPNGAVISADKMNVVYRGLDNPMTISVPGVADNKVRATATGLRKAGGVGKYMMNPGKGKEAVINVSFTLPNGSTESSRAVYRIKNIPQPMATVRKQAGIVKMSKSSLEKTTVRVELPDFLFDLQFKIKSFKIKVPGQATITVNGSRLNAQAKAALKRARSGDMVAIFDVKSSIVGNSKLRIADALPVNIEIQ